MKIWGRGERLILISLEGLYLLSRISLKISYYFKQFSYNSVKENEEKTLFSYIGVHLVKYIGSEIFYTGHGKEDSI